MSRLLFSFIALSALFCVCSDLAAGMIYKWVDERGEVHFSDALPAGKAKDVKVLEVARIPDVVPGNPSYYFSVTNQARRLEEQRLARDKALAEKRKLQAERRWLEEQQPVDPSPDSPATAVSVYPAPYYRPFRPWSPRIERRYPDDHPAYRSFRPPHRLPSYAIQPARGKHHAWNPAR